MAVEAAVERRLEELEVRVRRLEAGDPEGSRASASRAPEATVRAIPADSVPRRLPQIPPEWLVPLASPGSARDAGDAGEPASSPRPVQRRELLSARSLAWLGGIATALGIAFLLALAISRGWIDQEMRTIFAGLGSLALIASACHLHRRRGRTEAAVAMVGAGTAGMFATVMVAGEAYHLVAPWLALAGALLTGVLATVLAIRWAGQAIAGIGLVGALLSPLFTGTPSTGGTIAVLLATTACATAVVVWRDWAWLALAAPLLAGAQWAYWLLAGGDGLAADLAVVTVSAGIGLAGAVGVQLRERAGELRPSAGILLALNACLTGAVGALALSGAAGIHAAELWLAALGAAHALAAKLATRRIHHSARTILIATGGVLVDVAFSLAVSGIFLSLGWAAVAVGCTWLVRRAEPGGIDETTLALGTATHVTLVLIRAAIAVPPTSIHGHGFVALLTVAVLAACCLTCGRVTASPAWRTLVDGVGLAAIAYLTAARLQGDALVLAWAAEAATLAQVHRRTHEDVPAIAALIFLGAAAIHVLLLDAPPVSLLTGARVLHSAAIALGALVVALLAAGRASGAPQIKTAATIAAAFTLLYLGSIAVVTVFQPSAGAPATLLDLSVRQEGQVVLSALWSILGLAGLIAGLRLRIRPLRTAGAGLLLLAIAKVFLFDLSTLTSIYRVISFVVLGLLLLVAALARQRAEARA
jgi:uncharacterized membrane protein